MMRNFIQLYFKEYVVKLFSVPLFLIVKALQIIFVLFSILYGLLKYPAAGFCILGAAVELTSDPIRYNFVAGFIIAGLFVIFFRVLENHIDFFFHTCLEKIKERIMRPVQLKTNMKFMF